MTVLNENNRSQYILSTTDQVLPTDFFFYDETHIIVVSDSRATLTLNVDYTVTLPQTDGGEGDVVMIDATVGEQITLVRCPPCTQLIDFVEGDAFPADLHERGLDLAMMLACKNADDLSRALTYPVNEFGTNNILPDKSERLDMLFYWDANGEPVAAVAGDLNLVILINDPLMGGATPSQQAGATQYAIKVYVDAADTVLDDKINDVEDAIEVPVNQVGHGFTQTGVAVRLDNSFNFVLALADSEANAQSVGLIAEIVDVDNIKVKFGGGEVTKTAHGFSEGPVFLSDTVPGGLTQTKPGIIKQVAYVKDVDTLIVVDTYPLIPADISGVNTAEQLITASGNFVVPAGVTRIKVKAVAGGGGGGGASSNGGPAFGGNPGTGTSGGAGETRVGIFDVTPGQNIAITIGAGGAGGAGNAAGAGSNGSVGGNTIIGAPVNMTANGGTNGTATGGSGSGGSGGSGGSYSIPGESGHFGHVGASPTIPPTDRAKSGFPTYGLGGNGSPGGGFLGWNAAGGVGGNGAVLIEW